MFWAQASEMTGNAV